MRWNGRVGFVHYEQTSPGVVSEKCVEGVYYGDVRRDVRRNTSGSNINSDLDINNSISIIADAYAYQHFQFIRYVEYMGVFWQVNSAEILRPRILLTIGGVYNGETSRTSRET